MLKTLRANVALLLIAANFPVIALAVWIGVRDFREADLADRDRLVQAAQLVAARATGLPADAAQDSLKRIVVQDRSSRAAIAVAILSRDGRVLADDAPAGFGRSWLSTEGPPKNALPSDERILKGRGSDGRAYRYAAAPIENSDATVIAATPFDFMGRSQTQWLILALGLPALMSLLCIGLVLFGIERFVLRWIRALRNSAEAYHGGRLDVAKASTMRGAPTELARLGEALDGMSQRIEERTVELKGAVEARDRLLRELHHRVKNNFQMIASLLALQRQEAPQSLSAVLRAPEDRVRAMAAAYKASYASGEIGHVDVGELLRDVALQARETGSGRMFDVGVAAEKDLGEVDLDRAVSLALLVMELLSAAGPANDSATLSAQSDGDGRAVVAVSAATSGWLPSTGLSQRLIRAYADQLSTTVEEDEAGSVRFAFALAYEKPTIGMRPRKAAR